MIFLQQKYSFAQLFPLISVCGQFTQQSLNLVLSFNFNPCDSSNLRGFVMHLLNQIFVFPRNSRDLIGQLNIFLSLLWNIALDRWIKILKSFLFLLKSPDYFQQSLFLLVVVLNSFLVVTIPCVQHNSYWWVLSWHFFQLDFETFNVTPQCSTFLLFLLEQTG